MTEVSGSVIGLQTTASGSTVTNVEGRRESLTELQVRWANLASLRVFNKSFDALVDDLDKTIGGITPDALASLIEMGKEIEVADASRMQLGSTPTPPARRTHMTQFQMWVVGVLAFAVVGGFWSTRWVYYDQKIGGVTGTATVRVRRWTGARQALQCGPVLTREAQEQVRSLQAQLAGIVESWPGILALEWRAAATIAALSRMSDQLQHGPGGCERATF
jgi:hypothetical protein